MNITVIGGGNIGTQFAVVMSSKGYNVTIFSSKPEKFGELSIVDENNTPMISVSEFVVTNDIDEACKDADIIFVTFPAFMFGQVAEDLYGHTKSNVKIGLIPGTGGGEFYFSKFIKEGATIFGLQRVPAVARLIEYGKSVCVQGKRDKLYVGAVPNSKTDEIAAFLSSVFDMPCGALPNYLSVTLTPSNPILHTTRLATLFKDYEIGKIYDKKPLFYGEWSRESSELLIACDAELQQLCKELPQMDLRNVKSLKLHYESADAESLTEKIRSIKSLHNLVSPMKDVQGGYIPDFTSRYFTADFPYGLRILKSFCDICNVPCENMQKTLRWAQRFIEIDDSKLPLPENYGIKSKEDIYKYYQEA